MKVYNKLVRDKIPEIILKDNELPSTRILNDEEYIQELNKKLQEEVNEYLEAENIEEMVDILEVIRAILEHKGVTYEEIEEKRIKKATKRGAFKEKIYLEKVTATRHSKVSFYLSNLRNYYTIYIVRYVNRTRVIICIRKLKKLSTLW